MVAFIGFGAIFTLGGGIGASFWNLRQSATARANNRFGLGSLFPTPEFLELAIHS
jgi:hypothetical protein